MAQVGIFACIVVHAYFLANKRPQYVCTKRLPPPLFQSFDAAQLPTPLNILLRNTPRITHRNIEG